MFLASSPFLRESYMKEEKKDHIYIFQNSAMFRKNEKMLKGINCVNRVIHPNSF